MKTIVLDDPGQLHLTDTALPGQPGPGEALVRVKRVGICGTDLHAFRGEQPFFEYPRILGHELGVEIVSLGPNTQGSTLAAGDRCAVEPYLNCGRCGACLRGKPNCCYNLRLIGVHIDGGMREYTTVPVSKLHKSSTLPCDHLALVEMLCVGHHAVARADVERGEQVLVIGAGPIGLSVIEFARLAGANVIVMEVSDHRLQFCRDHLGVDRVINGKVDPLPQLQALLSGELPTTVFDATGNRNSMIAAFRDVANGGKLVLVGFVQGDITFNSAESHRREMTLLDSRNATAADFAQVIRTLEQGTIDLAPWITHRASPDEIVVEFPRWLDPTNNVIKAMLQL